MKKLILLLVLIMGIASLASAEILIYANTLPQGKWGFEGAYVKDSNVSNMADVSLTSYGVKAAYGLTDRLELDVAYGMGSYAGLGAGNESSVAPASGVVRYNLLAEDENIPASVTIAAGYQSIPVKSNLGGVETRATYGKSGVGMIVSKMVLPFIPYLGLTYNSLNQDGINVLSTELTIGTALAWSQEGQVMIEYTNQSIVNDPTGGNFTSPQIGVGVLYSFI